jgi:TonB family protein
MTEVWKKWEGEVINGAFPLRRFLGGSDHSGVFLTEHQAQNLPNAAIKLVPAARAETQLSRWSMAATLSHPHLIRLLDAGRCQLGDEPFVFVVMEYAEQSLSEILPHRALTADEVRELLLPTLDVLAFLHRRDLVQGHLKPSNFLVVDDELKLASDTIHTAGESATVIAEPSVYDPPEAKDGRISAAGDVWGLGVTLVETLTQSTEIGSLPATLPPRFVETVWRCRSRNPDDRPTVMELEAQFGRPPPAPAPVVSIPEPVVSIPEAIAPIPRPAGQKVAERAVHPPKSPGQRRLVPTITGLIVIVVAVWVSLRLFHSNSNSQRPAPGPSQISPQPAAPPAVPAPPEVPVQPPAEAPASVLHEEIPNVPRSSSDTIHGTITVVVRVTVDRSGSVVDESLEDPGPSKYFARLATTAARNWKFSPTVSQNSRQWLVSFAFTRDSTTGHATPPE